MPEVGLKKKQSHEKRKDPEGFQNPQGLFFLAKLGHLLSTYLNTRIYIYVLGNLFYYTLFSLIIIPHNLCFHSKMRHAIINQFIVNHAVSSEQ